MNLGSDNDTQTTNTKYYAVVLVAFLWMTLVGPYPFPTANASLVQIETSDPIRQVLYSCILLSALAPYLARDPLIPFRTMPPAMWVLLGWCLLTLLWSPVPDIGLRRLVLTAMIVMTAFLIGGALGLQRTVTITAYTLAGLTILSVVAVVAYPSGAVHQPGELDLATVGRWRGLFEQKNVAGSIASLALVFSVFLGRRRLVDCIILVGAALLLWFSGSRTSLAAVLMACVLTPVVLWSLRGRTFLLVVPILILVAVVATGFGEQILAIFNDPYALTGRGAIWQALWNLVQSNPLTGVGYGSIFLAGENGALGRTDTWLALAAHGHNSYLETTASAGLIGLILLLWVVVVGPYRSMSIIQHDPLEKTVLPAVCSIWIFTLLHNIFEGGFLDRDRATWVVLVLLLAGCRPVVQRLRSVEEAGLAGASVQYLNNQRPRAEM